MLSHPFLGRKRYISNNFKDARKVHQGVESNDLTTLTTAIHIAKDRRQQMTSQTSMVWTFRLTSKISSDKLKED